VSIHRMVFETMSPRLALSARILHERIFAVQVCARAESAPMKRSLPILLTFNGGYVGTTGFLAFQGLFTAHVTGNFVTLGTALVLGTGGIVNKLIALPVFCLVVSCPRSCRQKPQA